MSVRTTKRKTLDDAVLKKARKFTEAPPQNQEESKVKATDTRKPRHSEMQKIEARAKTQKSAKVSGNDSGKTSTTGKKKSKNKKRKKKKQLPKEKNPDAEAKRKTEALAYLKLWEKYRDQWKFEKLKQLWLLKHALKPSAIDSKNFELLLQYASSIQGHSRSTFAVEMKNFIEDYESKFNQNPKPMESNDDASGVEATDIDKIKYERARQLVQSLTDD